MGIGHAYGALVADVLLSDAHDLLVVARGDALDDRWELPHEEALAGFPDHSRISADRFGNEEKYYSSESVSPNHRDSSSPGAALLGMAHTHGTCISSD